MPPDSVVEKAKESSKPTTPTDASKDVKVGNVCLIIEESPLLVPFFSGPVRQRMHAASDAPERRLNTDRRVLEFAVFGSLQSHVSRYNAWRRSVRQYEPE